MRGEKFMYKSFKIKNYKAIEDQEIDLSKQNLFPIIGLNETGKSTVLEAITAFDTFNDHFQNGSFVNYSKIKNKFYDGDCIVEISAEIEGINYEKLNPEYMADTLLNISRERITKETTINSTDLDHKYKTASESLETILGEKIQKLFSKIPTKLVIKRKIESSGKVYSIENLEIPQITIKKEELSRFFFNDKFSFFSKDIMHCISREIVRNMPHIIYMDDFRDNVPEEITEDTKEWYKYIEEIIKQHSSMKNIEEFLSRDKRERETILHRVSGKLNKELMNIWEELHIISSAKKDFENSEIELKYSDEIFYFNINDKRSKDYHSYFSVNERSKGFKWFFNFFIKLKYNHKYFESGEYRAIILLDEPGAYLHTEFQQQLAKILKELSNDNKVFYCTHLENLVDPEIIPPKLIHIAKREDERVKIYKYNDCSDDTSSLGELAPLINAFKLKNFPSTFRQEKIILTEGPSEQSFFKLLQEADLFSKKIVVIPGAGCANLSSLLSLISGFAEKYTMLLDGDAKKDYEKYKEEFSEEESEKWIVHHIKGSEKSELEDYYSSGMKEVLRHYINQPDLNEDKFDYKSTIQKFYYGAEEDFREKFFKELEKEILNKKSNLSILKKRIYKILDITE